ncbi:hypothetical protein PAXINDRAFT_16973 [Paxillus involutus ATCC 200175]|uniref:Uncharacterized protein n=1 Tax=Paxillus involutus ATCC 200175 TaxID=664439 RepID=A0A0C9T2S8_PAXIN|nr:hypothetical protein PAXINDRAFT_16973 [Paxillus involutus ATCC 200175]
MSESGLSAEPQAELNSEQGHSNLGSVKPADGDIEGDGNEEIVQKHCEKRRKPANDKGTGSKNKDGSRQERKRLKGRAKSGNETADEEGIDENVPTKRKGKGTDSNPLVSQSQPSAIPSAPHNGISFRSYGDLADEDNSNNARTRTPYNTQNVRVGYPPLTPPHLALPPATTPLVHIQKGALDPSTPVWPGKQGAGNEDEGGNDEGGKEDEGRNEDEGGDGVGGVSGGERKRKWGGRDDKDKDRDKGKVEADEDDEINNVDHRNSEHSNEKDKVDEYECGEDEVDEYKHGEDGEDDYLPDQRHNSEDNASFTGGHEALSDSILAPLTKSLRIRTSGAVKLKANAFPVRAAWSHTAFKKAPGGPSKSLVKSMPKTLTLKTQPKAGSNNTQCGTSTVKAPSQKHSKTAPPFHRDAQQSARTHRNTSPEDKEDQSQIDDGDEDGGPCKHKKAKKFKNKDLPGLPDTMKPWRDNVLPHFLLCVSIADDPWDLVRPMLLEYGQRLWDHYFPDLDRTPAFSHEPVYALHAEKAVEAFFDQYEEFTTAAAHAAYIEWAIPEPEERLVCKGRKVLVAADVLPFMWKTVKTSTRDPSDIVTKDLFHHQVILDTFTFWLESMDVISETARERKSPHAALTLCIVAVERAFRRWLTGHYVMPPKGCCKFSQALWEYATNEYIQSVERLTERKWKKLFQAAEEYIGAHKPWPGPDIIFAKQGSTSARAKAYETNSK